MASPLKAIVDAVGNGNVQVSHSNERWSVHAEGPVKIADAAFVPFKMLASAPTLAEAAERIWRRIVELRGDG